MIEDKTEMSFLVMTASTSMPSSVKAPYRKIAIVELEEGFVGRPKMISNRAKGVKKIIHLWDRLHAHGPNCVYNKILSQAITDCNRFNAGE